MADLTGQIVALAQAQGLFIGWVQKHDKNRLQIYDVKGRSQRIAEKLLIAPLTSASSPDDAQVRIQQEIDTIAAMTSEVDTQFLWECCSDRPGERQLDDLSETYFGEAQPRQLAALFSAVVGDDIHFKTSIISVQVRTEEVVTSRQLAVARELERETWRTEVTAGLGALLTKPLPDELPPLPDGTGERLERYLYGRQRDELETILNNLPGKQSARDKAFTVLELLGLLPPDADRLLLVAGFNPDFNATVEEAAQAVTQPDLNDRESFEELVSFSIDDDDTREVDDAITLERLDDGRVRVGIHIADASAFVKPGDPLDREALQRVSTMYLPHRMVTMLPERISCDLASLREQEDRPTLSCLVDLDGEGTITNWRLMRGRLSVGHRLNYEEADQIVAGELAHPLSDDLQILDAVTSAMLAERRQDGAIFINRPELKVKQDGETISIKRIEQGSASRRIISELMILYNRLTANIAEDNGVKVIYRVQDQVPDIEIPEEYEPEKLDAVFRSLRPSRLSVHPQVHAGLGLARYVQASSPLRRYTDLIIQRQLSAFLADETPPYDAEELLQIIGDCLGVEKEYRVLERDATRSLLLTHLQAQDGMQPRPAIVLNSESGGPKAELCEYLLRGSLVGAARANPGDTVQVRIDEADPKSGRLVMRRIT